MNKPIIKKELKKDYYLSSLDEINEDFNNFEIHDIFVCGTQYEKKSSYTWQQIAKEPLILLENNSASRRYINDQFSKKHIHLTPLI